MQHPGGGDILGIQRCQTADGQLQIQVSQAMETCSLPENKIAKLSLVNETSNWRAQAREVPRENTTRVDTHLFLIAQKQRDLSISQLH